MTTSDTPSTTTTTTTVTTGAGAAAELRWSECDTIADPIQRIECRTSHLNDGFHALTLQLQADHHDILEAIDSLRSHVEHEIKRLDGRDDLSTQDRAALRKRVTLVGMIAGPLLTTALKLATDHLHLV